MPNTKISALTAGNPAQGTDEIPIARGAANFKVTAASIAALSPAGTVTSVGGTGTVNGITLTGTVTSTGNLTLGGTLSGVSLTTQVSGTLPLANGGTGATTKAAAFNALSPVSATGDLIVGNGVNSNTRIAIGGFGRYLFSNGTTASWQFVDASNLQGLVQANQGGTGTTTSPSNGQILIGNGGGYSVNNLTAGTGITITNSFGNITIAVTVPPTTINVLSVSTSSGSFNNSPPSSSVSKPLVGSVSSPSNYGAFSFQNFSGAGSYYVTSASISSISGIDSASASFSYSLGPDFSHSGVFTVMDTVVSCYGLLISNPAMQTLFSGSAAAITTPSVAPLFPSSALGVTNPYMRATDGSNSWDTNGPSSGALGIVVQKLGGTYFVYFGSNDTSPYPGVVVTNLQFYINNSFSSYNSGSDFNVSSAENTSFGQFYIQMSVSNPTLQTLLDNSFLT